MTTELLIMSAIAFTSLVVNVLLFRIAMQQSKLREKYWEDAMKRQDRNILLLRQISRDENYTLRGIGKNATLPPGSKMIWQDEHLRLYRKENSK